MIYGDSSEKKKTHDAFTEKLGEDYAIKELGVFDCELKKILLSNETQAGIKTFCTSTEETPILLDNGFEYAGIKEKCRKCDHGHYVRFADFEIATERAYYERKTAADFVASRKGRLYSQLDRMDMFVEDGRKGLILEFDLDLGYVGISPPSPSQKKNRPNGMPRDWKPPVKLHDSKSFFSGYDKKVHNLRGLSPLEQVIEIGGNPEWTYSFIREIGMLEWRATLAAMLFRSPPTRM